MSTKLENNKALVRKCFSAIERGELAVRVLDGRPSNAISSRFAPLSRI